MHKNFIEKFMEMYCNALNNESQYKPISGIIFDGICPPSNEEIVVFKISQVIAVYNDEWQVKSTQFFLIYQGQLFFLAAISTNYEETIVFSNSQEFRVNFSGDDITILYSIETTGSGPQGKQKRTIPKDKWHTIKFLVTVVSLPAGEEPERFRQALVDKKFGLDICELNKKLPYKTKDRVYMIPKEAVIPVLKTAGQRAAAAFWDKQSEYIAFPTACFKLE